MQEYVMQGSSILGLRIVRNFFADSRIDGFGARGPRYFCPVANLNFVVHRQWFES